MIKIPSASRTFYLKKLKFEHRKIIHYTLLACVILLQITAIIIWYNETKNETKLSNTIEDIASSKKIINYTYLINNSLIESQEHFGNYLNDKDENNFQKYSASLNNVNRLLDSLQILGNEKSVYKKIISKKDQTQTQIVALKATIDSIINNQTNKNHDEDSNLFKFSKFESKKILDSVKTDSYIKVDSISRKGLLARLGDAFAGRLNVQKEQLNTVVTMKYKDKVITGSIEDQLKTVFNKTNNYYQNEFLNLKKTFLELENKDAQLITLNNDLLKISQTVISNYKNSADLLQTGSENNIINQFLFC